MRFRRGKRLLALSAIVGLPVALAHETHVLEALKVEGRETVLLGEAISASEGYIGRIDLEARPMLRTGEILEAVPGMVVTQHSGSGKANQFFLRGFNLDHGTDFATWIDGMPVNMVSHGHGQGYTDINFVIPELVEHMNYFKGPYYAAVGDFSSAGSVRIKTVNSLESGLALLSMGENNHVRALLSDSQTLGSGELLFALERQTYDGPWELEEDFDKHNGLLKFTQPTDEGSVSFTLMGYDASWTSTDQIPERAIEQGLITPLGNIDDSVGGESSRYSASAEWVRTSGGSTTRVDAYAISYDMNLWSNFTYFLDDPVNGDQFEQLDERMIYGFSVTRSQDGQTLFNQAAQSVFGFQLRFDDIDKVGLYRSNRRQRLSTVREDSVEELAISAYYETILQWSGKWKTTLGVRADRYAFDVDSDRTVNSGSDDDIIFSPKVNTIYSASDDMEFYFSAGYGFHSNDARGSTISVDPADPGTSVDPVDPFARSKGAEIGARFRLREGLNSSIAVWGLELDSELLFVGDAGNTEATLPSERFGLEFANYFAPTDWLSFDFDLAFTDSSFEETAASEDEIPGSIDKVASIGANIVADTGWFGAVRLRHFGERPLVEDGSVVSGSFSAVNTRFGYAAENWRISIDLLNALDTDSQDIAYFYASRLQGEPAEGVEDSHIHIIEPRSARLNFTWEF